MIHIKYCSNCAFICYSLWLLIQLLSNPTQYPERQERVNVSFCIVVRTMYYLLFSLLFLWQHGTNRASSEVRVPKSPYKSERSSNVRTTMNRDCSRNLRRRVSSEERNQLI